MKDEEKTMAEQTDQNTSIDPTMQKRLLMRKRGFMALGGIFAVAAVALTMTLVIQSVDIIN